MANPVWPASLPAFVESGFDERGRDSLLRSPMDSGPPKVRRRFTAAPRPLRAQLLLSTAAAVDAFQDFFDNTIKDGALPFDWVHPRTQLVRTFRLKSPYGLRHVSGPIYEASLDLEILP